MITIRRSPELRHWVIVSSAGILLTPWSDVLDAAQVEAEMRNQGAVGIRVIS